MNRLSFIMLAATISLLAACSSAPPKPVVKQQAAPIEPVSSRISRPKVAVGERYAQPTTVEELKRSIYFDFDRYDIREEFKGVVADHARRLNQRKDSRILIQGNTDERGSSEYNLALGQKRANSVKRALLLLGAEEIQVESVSLGKEKPRNLGHNEAAWAENRRADILFSGEY